MLTKSDPMRLVIADDHFLMRDALRVYIETEKPGSTVFVADDARGVLEIVEREADLDIAILDYRMPGMDGLAGLDAILDRRPDLPVAIMSGIATATDIQNAMARGAAGYLPKTMRLQAVFGAIHLMVAGERYLPADTYTQAEAAETERSNGVQLSQRERQVLDGLFSGQSNKEIARTIDLQEVTIKVHVRSLCRKLAARNRTQAVLRAMELGLA